ncbi:MAG: CheR family methyltransferase, partial [Spirochaetota bacterium]
EHDGRLYIILDVERILGDGSEEEQAQIESTAATNAGDALKFAEETSPRTRREEPEPGPAEAEEPLRGASSSVAEMVAQTLQTLTGFTMTSINRTWVEERLNQWQSEHAGDAEITTQEHVEEFLSTFYSPYRGRFWDEDYANQLKKVLPADLKGNITVWNPGCGRGHEAYSIACLVRSAYPEARIKVWAEDNDLLNVSSAPSLAFTREEVPGWYEPYLVEGSNGPRFSSEIRDSILFEYSEVTNASSVPPCDLIVIRDVLSFLSERDQRRVLEMIEDRAKDKTIVVPGANEDLLPVGGFTEVTQGAVRAFRIG